MTNLKHLNRIYRKKELPAVCGLRSTVIDEMIAAGTFPKGFQLNGPNGRALGWLESELIAWQEACLAARDSGKQAPTVRRGVVARRAAA